MRRLGYAWKRGRRRLRAQHDPDAFATCQQLLQALHRAEAGGGAAVVYVDECCFSRQAPMPYAGQHRGQSPVELPVVRGGGGYSVLGFWQPGAPGQPWTPTCASEPSPLTSSYWPATSSSSS